MSTAGSLTLHAGIQEVPPDHAGTYELQAREVAVTAATYAEALAQVESDVDEGWRVVWLRVDRDQ